MSFWKWYAQEGGVIIHIVNSYVTIHILVLKLRLCKSSCKYADVKDCSFAVVCGIKLFSRPKPVFLFSQEIHSFYVNRFHKENAMHAFNLPVSLHIIIQWDFLITFVVHPWVFVPVGEGIWSWQPSRRQFVNGWLVWDAALDLTSGNALLFHVSVELKPGNRHYVFKSKKNAICSRV